MRILVTTGIFEPESGGPATYTPELARGLVAAGHEVTVITFSSSDQNPNDTKYPFRLVRVKRAGLIANRIRMYRAIKKEIQACDFVYTLDWFAVGLPVLVASLRFHKSYIARIGGDYMWEQKYLSSTAEPLPLTDFYAKGLYKRPRLFLGYLAIRLVLTQAAHVVFNSDVQRELYQKYFGLTETKTSTVYNPLPNLGEAVNVESFEELKEFIFWGRLIVMKNVDTLIKAFAIAHLPAEYRLTIIGDGPERVRLLLLIRELKLDDRVTILPSMSQKEVFIRAKTARAFILPSWTDISPNQVCEALTLGIPGIITRENYLPFRDQLPLLVDPRHVNDIADKLKACVDPIQYADIKKKWSEITFTKTWGEVIQEHLALFTSMYPTL